MNLIISNIGTILSIIALMFILIVRIKLIKNDFSIYERIVLTILISDLLFEISYLIITGLLYYYNKAYIALVIFLGV
jgi:hypothetical protein